MFDDNGAGAKNTIIITLFYLLSLAVVIFFALVFFRGPSWNEEFNVRQEKNFIPPKAEFDKSLKTFDIKPVEYPKAVGEGGPAATASTVRLLNLDTYESPVCRAWEKLFRQAGIPFVRCKSADEFSDSAMAVVCRTSERPYAMDTSESYAIKKFVANGGFLIGDGLTGLRHGMLKDVFGYKDCSVTNSRKLIRFAPDFECACLDEPEEKAITLSRQESSIWTNGIIAGHARPIAFYEDGSAAITVNSFEKGKAVLLGASMSNLYLRNLVNRHFQPNAKYANSFEPMSDVFMLLVRSFYERACPEALTLATAPAGYKATFIMTHDVDCVVSVNNILKFAELEEKLGIRSTFFMQSKYIRDYNDEAFYDSNAVSIIKNIAARGFEVGSHSVIHSKILNKFPFGTGKESYPEYSPYVTADSEVAGEATLCGEIGVSKSLMGTEGVFIDSFRPGHLIYHRMMPEALEKYYYSCSSTFTACDSLTFFPFMLVKEADKKNEESVICEFPVAIEDEESPLSGRLDECMALIKKIGSNGGMICALIHPDLTQKKGKDKDLDFEEKLVMSLPADCWKTTMRDAGKFWSRRNATAFSCLTRNGSMSLTVFAPEDFDGMAFKKNGDFRNIPVEGVVGESGEVIIIEKVKKGTNRYDIKIREGNYLQK